MITQEPLPYQPGALAPFISSNTLNVHYGKHHRTYVEKANELLAKSDLKDLPHEEIIRKAAANPQQKALFNNAAQAWNHSFYWHSLKPGAGGQPGSELLKLIKKAFGGYEDFRKQFQATAVGHFASGWAWLVLEDGKLKITDTHDADSPLVRGQTPLLTLDLWEHAYYLDYQNKRASYVEAFLDHLADWGFAESNLSHDGHYENKGFSSGSKIHSGTRV